jgi:thiol:disulfide interchange protein DsbD
MTGHPIRLAGMLALVALLSYAQAPSAAQSPADDPFDKQNELPAVVVKGLLEPKAIQPAPAEDPFDFQNKLTFDPLQPQAARPVDHLSLFASVEPKSALPGQTVRLTISGQPDSGYHAYPVCERTPALPDIVTKLLYADSPDFQPVWKPFDETKPEFEREADDSILLVYNGAFTLSQDILIKTEAKPGTKTLRLRVDGMVCDAKGCIPYRYPLSVDIEVLAGNPVPISASLQERLRATGPEIVVTEPTATGAVEGTPAPDADHSFSGIIFVSMAAAIAMLFTPCVFPMIPITVSFFLKQSEKQNHNAPLTAAVYSATIVVVLTAAVLLLGGLIVQLANNPWVNLLLAAVLGFFALSLFGMYEIELPSWLAQYTSAHEGKGGYVGAFFMALTFTITSFTCTGPFLGPLLISTKEMQLTTDRVVVAAFTYSATFAAPFFVLALFPRLLRTLPKSGGWLNAVKVVMGFLELGAALKFAANTDLALNPGAPMIFNYDAVLCAWIALSIACGLYLLGLYRLPHDTAAESIGVPRMVIGTVFLGLAVYMMPALWRITPQGVVGEGIVAFLPWDSRAGQQELEWTRDFEKAWETASAAKKPIFIDFTGVNCTNCRANEKNVFVRPEVRNELKKYVLVQLYTDSVPDEKLTPSEAASKATANRELLGETYNDVSNPFYAIVRPQAGAPALVMDSNGKPKLNGANLQWTRKGLIPKDKIADFEEFLRTHASH